MTQQHAQQRKTQPTPHEEVTGNALKGYDQQLTNPALKIAMERALAKGKIQPSQKR